MKKIKQQSNHLIRMVALLALLLVGINASWAQVLTANFGKQVGYSEGEYGHWIELTADRFEGFSDGATVCFEYYVEGYDSEYGEVGAGNVSSFEDATSKSRTHILDIKYTKNGWNRFLISLGELKTKMKSTTTSDEKQGLTSNAWYKDKGQCTKSRVVVYELGAPAGDGWWDPANKEYSWTSSSNNLVKIFDGITGSELKTKYDRLLLNTSNYTEGAPYRVVFMNGETVVATITLYTADNKDINLTTHKDTKDVDLSTVDNIRFGGAEHPGSINIEPASVKLVQSFTVNFKGVKDGNTADAPDWGTVTAKVNGVSINSGDKVPYGTEVTFSANAIDNYFAWGWYKNNTRYWGTNVITVDQDLNMYAVLDPGIDVTAITNDGIHGGSVNVTRGGDSGTTIHVSKYPGETVFTATPIGGATFDGWYSTSNYADGDLVSEDNPLYCSKEKGHEIQASNFTLYAKFTPPAYDPSFDLSATPTAKGSNATWDNGTLTASGPSDNWALVKDVTGHGSEFTGIEVTTNGDAARIIVRYGSGSDQAIKTIDAADGDVKSYYSWEMLGVPGDQIEHITEIRFAGKQDWAATYPSTVTFKEASLVNRTEVTPDYEIDNGYVKFVKKDTRIKLYNRSFEMGSNVTSWVYKEKDADKYVTMNTTDKSNNMMQIFKKGTGGYNINDFVGVQITSKGDHYRLIVKSKIGENAEKTFEYTVPETAEKTTHRIEWSDVILQYGSAHMTYEDVQNITLVEVAGCNNHTVDESVDFYDIWLDKYFSHVQSTAEGQGEIWNGGTLTYTDALGAKIVFTNVNGSQNSRDSSCGGLKFHQNRNDDLPSGYPWEMNVTAPAGYKITKLRVEFADDTHHGDDGNHYHVSFNYGYAQKGTGNFAEYIRSNDDRTYDEGRKTYKEDGTDVRMVIPGDAKMSELHILSISYDCEAIAINESRTVSTTFNGNTVTRDYWIYAPQKIMTDQTSATYPVVFSLHGTGNDYQPTNDGVQNYNKIADKENFIVIYPRGRELTFPGWGGTARGWEATGVVNQDIQYFKDIIAELKKSGSGVKINENQIYITGFSNGGMMAYAAANCASDVFAAFASTSGIPVNEMHLQHNGPRAVPFLHIHGDKDDFVNYKHLPTIVDNMVARNGLPYTPTSTQYVSTHKYSVYEATGKQPYYVYEVYGMGHNKECNLDGTDSKQVIWEFFKLKNKVGTTTTEFEPDLSNDNVARAHGWSVKDGSTLLYQYGESGGWTSTGQNVYHSLQLAKGKHYIKFTSSNSNAEKYVTVRLIKLGSLDNFNTLNNNSFALGTEGGFAEGKQEKSYKVGETVIEIDVPEGGAEYQLTISKGAAGDATTITGLKIETTGTKTSNEVETVPSTDFAGYFNYNNRLAAQWNFDQCDGYRFNVNNLASCWVKTTNGDETIYTLNQSIGTGSGDSNAANYAELTYDGQPATLTNKIAVTAGLKFNAPKNSIKIIVKAGARGVHLQVDEHVKMLIPYVENSFRNDTGNDAQPPYNFDAEVDKEGHEIAGSAEAKQTLYKEYENCMHHIKRDIVYFGLSTGNIWNVYNPGVGWSQGHILNKCIDDASKDLFNSGGEEFVNGHHFYKANYMGNHGTPCIVQFQKATTFDRIGVNRNLTYSFYTEYVSDLGASYATPKPGMRIVGSPVGQKVANLGSTYTSYENAIAMTYGGWKGTESNKMYSPYDHTKPAISDTWDELGVYNGGEEFYTWTSMPAPTATTDLPIATDGFPVFSRLQNPATNEGLMPDNTTGNGTTPNYHPAHDGKFSTSYTENETPWTLPCRGGYIKFEPTLPGVLNVDILQMGAKINGQVPTYYIADEFGKLITSNVFAKTASAQTIKVVGQGFQIYNGGNDTHSDYAKYSFDVYPGKTYYLFSNDAGLGFVGFLFEPYVKRVNTSDEFSRKDVGMKELTLNNGSSDDFASANLSSLTATENITSPGTNGDVTYPIVYSKDAATVTLNRSFDANKWSAICLPYSINQVQVEKVFGKGTQIILLRDIQSKEHTSNNKTKANFIMHLNQDIIAGYPYLIKPTVSSNSITTNAHFEESTPNPIVINGKGKDSYYTGLSYTGITDYDFKGSYAPTFVPNGSYVISGGELKRLTTGTVDGTGDFAGKKGTTSKAYRSWIQYGGTDQEMQAKAISIFSTGNFDDSDDNATSIDDILFNQGILTNKANVYSINGQMVGKNIDNLQNLPKGIYVVNGKKFIVK